MAKRFQLFLMVLVLLYSSFLMTITIRRYFNYHSELIDLSYYYMAVQQMANGHAPRIWDIPSRYVFGDHVELVLFGFIPFIKLANSPFTLFFIQAVWVISGSFPLYLITKHKLSSPIIGWVLCLTYLSFSGLQMGYAYGFHPIVLFPPFFFWLWYFFEKKQSGWYYLFLILTLWIKEETAFIMMSTALYQGLIRKRWQTAIATFILSLIWAIICFAVIFPQYNPGVGFGHLGQYAQVIQQPHTFFQTLINPRDKITMLFQTFNPVAWLPWLNPPSLLLILPSLLEKLLSNNIARLNGFHYSAALAGCMMIATLETLDRFKKTRRLWVALLLFLAALSMFRYAYAPFLPHQALYEIFDQPRHVLVLNQVIDTLPKNARVTAQYQIAARMTWSHGKLLPLPQPNETADFVLLNTNLPLVLTTPDQVIPYLENLEASGNYEALATDDDRIIILRSRLGDH